MNLFSKESKMCSFDIQLIWSQSQRTCTQFIWSQSVPLENGVNSTKIERERPHHMQEIGYFILGHFHKFTIKLKRSTYLQLELDVNVWALELALLLAFPLPLVWLVVLDLEFDIVAILVIGASLSVSGFSLLSFVDLGMYSGSWLSFNSKSE